MSRPRSDVRSIQTEVETERMRSHNMMCPYYTSDNAFCVLCDGGKVNFPSQKRRKEWLESYCGNNPGWQKCSVADMLNKYFEL